jgi:uncharacterized cupredoxin-like copper-binding protein
MTRTAIAAVAGAASLALAAGASGGGLHKAATTKTLSADPGGDLTFTKERMRAKRGRVTLVMRNPSSSGLPHGIGIKRKRGENVDPGGTSRVSIRLTPGSYTYYCTVAGHRGAGMKGRLTVTR